MADKKTIILVDMNSFYASCHQSEDPALRNKPVIVGGIKGNSRKGMVIAASYEAKAKGVFTTQSMYEATKLCPEAVVVERNHPLYNDYSQKIMTFLRLIGPTEVASVDEAYVDITTRVQEGKTPKSIANYIQQTIYSKIHIGTNIGISYNKFIAKMASEIRKPMGITHLEKIQFFSYFHPQKIGIMHGCGKKTEEKLNQHGYYTIGDLAKANPLELKIILGLRGEWLHLAALGKGSDVVDAEREKGDSTIGKEKTFREPEKDPEVLLSLLSKMLEPLCEKLKTKKIKAKTITLVYRLERDKGSQTKSLSLPSGLDDYFRMNFLVESLFDKHLEGVPLYLVGVRLSNFEDASFEQLKLF